VYYLYGIVVLLPVIDMSKFFFCFLLFFLLSYSSLFAQSLQPESSAAKKDSILFQHYIDSGEMFEINHPDVAKSYYKKAYSFALQKNRNRLLSIYFLRYIHFLNNQSKFEDALDLAQQHIKTAQALHDDRILMLAYNEAANEYEYLSDYQPATEYYIKALQLANSTRDTTMKQKINNNLASVFLFLKDYSTGYNYAKEAYLITQQQKDTVTMGNCLINLGVAELHQNKYSEALSHFKESEMIGYRIPDMTLVADALSDQGLAYYTMHRIGEAENSYEKDKAICDKYDLHYQKLYALFELAVIAKDKGDLRTASSDAMGAIDIGERLGTADELMEMYDTMAVIKEKSGDLRGALYYRKKYEGTNDPLLNEQIQTNVHHLTIQYHSAQKDKQIAEQNLSIEKTKTEIERKNIWLFIFLGGIVALTIILILSLRSHRNKQKLHQQSLLTLQKQHEVNTLKAKMQAREEERDRIAREMHDDIGSALTTILYLSDDLKTQAKEMVMRSADKIADTAASVVDKMNEIIWSMNSDYDTLDDLIAYTREHASEFMERHRLKYCLHVPEPIPVLHLSGEQRRNIYLVIKESLHNIVKHACATTVNISFKINDDLYISIHDNGKGFDKESTRRFGNGLKNMSKRMESIGGSFVIRNDKGTLVNLYCPLHVDAPAAAL
jgi:two-component system, NarL family, sensor kinase